MHKCKQKQGKKSERGALNVDQQQGTHKKKKRQCQKTKRIIIYTAHDKQFVQGHYANLWD
jgi:hypothetical protein